MSQMFPESDERTVPYHLCRVNKPTVTFSHIPEVGSRVPWLEWPSARHAPWHSLARSIGRPSTFGLVKYAEVLEVPTATPPHHTKESATPPRPKRSSNKYQKGRPRKDLKPRNGWSPTSQAIAQGNTSSEHSSPSSFSPFTHSSLETIPWASGLTQLQASSHDSPLSRMVILEKIARSFAALPPPASPLDLCCNGVLGDTPATHTHSNSVFSSPSSSPLDENPLGRGDDVSQFPTSPLHRESALQTSQVGHRNSVEAGSSSALGLHPASSNLKRKHEGTDDTDLPAIPLRVSKRRRTPTQRAQAQTSVLPFVKMRAGTVGGRTARTSQVKQEKPGEPLLSSPTPPFPKCRRRRRGRNADDSEVGASPTEGRLESNSDALGGAENE